MIWQDGLRKKQTKFGLQRTLDGKNIADINPIEEIVAERKKANKSLAERKKREAERLAVANRKGQTTLEKENECVNDSDLRIDRFEELIEICKNLITLIKQSDVSTTRDFRVEIAEAYNTLSGTYNEIYMDMFCFKNQLDNE